eukprot:gene3951-4959_t
MLSSETMRRDAMISDERITVSDRMVRPAISLLLRAPTSGNVGADLRVGFAPKSGGDEQYQGSVSKPHFSAETPVLSALQSPARAGGDYGDCRCPPQASLRPTRPHGPIPSARKRSTSSHPSKREVDCSLDHQGSCALDSRVSGEDQEADRWEDCPTSGSDTVEDAEAEAESGGKEVNDGKEEDEDEDAMKRLRFLFRRKDRPFPLPLTFRRNMGPTSSETATPRLLGHWDAHGEIPALEAVSLVLWLPTGVLLTLNDLRVGLSAQEIICLLKLISVESLERNSGWRELRRRRNAFRENVLRNIRAEASGTAGPRLVLDHPRMQVLGLPVERWTRVASPPLTEREDGDDWVARCTATALREQVLGEFEFKNILYLCHFMKVLGSADNFTERYFCSGACTAGMRQSIVQFVHTLVLQSARSCTLAPEGFPFPDPPITSTGLCAGLFGPIPVNPEANRSPRSARRAVRPVSAGRGRPSPPVSRLLRSKFEFDEKKHDGPLNGSLADSAMNGVAAPPSVSLQFYLRGGGGRCDRSLPQRIDATDSSLKLSERFF